MQESDERLGVGLAGEDQGGGGELVLKEHHGLVFCVLVKISIFWMF